MDENYRVEEATEEFIQELLDNGWLVENPTEDGGMWMPIITKDNAWRNYYRSRSGAMLHLRGGWMYNESADVYAKKENPEERNKRLAASQIKVKNNWLWEQFQDK